MLLIRKTEDSICSAYRLVKHQFSEKIFRHSYIFPCNAGPAYSVTPENARVRMTHKDIFGEALEEAVQKKSPLHPVQRRKTSGRNCVPEGLQIVHLQRQNKKGSALCCKSKCDSSRDDWYSEFKMPQGLSAGAISTLPCQALLGACKNWNQSLRAD